MTQASSLCPLRALKSPAGVPAVIAHRGLSHCWPENTLAAFTAAVQAGVHAVELDFRTTADGELICVHDDRLPARLAPQAAATLGRRPVEQANWDELRTIDVGRWKSPEHAGTTIPTLAQALKAITPEAVAVIERKTGSVRQTLAAIDRAGALDRVVINAFNWSYLRELHAAEPRLALSLCGQGPLTASRRRAIAAMPGCVVHWHHRDITAAQVRELHQAGHAVWVWTANTDAELRACFQAVVDGITTDHSDRLLAMLNLPPRRHPAVGDTLAPAAC
jgi:glycerophosphoryl diester phosphodiesterase